MKINSLLESQTPSSAISNTTSSAPEFGRDDEHLEETTTSGSVATVASPVGNVQRRGKGSMLQGIKTSAKFPNSKTVKEADEWEEEGDKFQRFLAYAQKQLAAVDRVQRLSLAKRLSMWQVKHFGPEQNQTYNTNTGAAIQGNNDITPSIRAILEIVNRTDSTNMPFGSVSAPQITSPQQTQIDNRWRLTDEGKQWLEYAKEELKKINPNSSEYMEVARALSQQQVEKFGRASMNPRHDITIEISMVIDQIRRESMPAQQQANQEIIDAAWTINDFIDRYNDASPQDQARIREGIQSEYGMSVQEFFDYVQEHGQMPPERSQAQTSPADEVFAETKKANTKTARKEFGKRTKKPTLSDKEKDTKQSESDRLWAMLQQHIADSEKEKEVKEANSFLQPGPATTGKFPEPRKPSFQGDRGSKSETLGKDGLIYHWQDPRAKQGMGEAVTLDRSKNSNYPNDPATVKHHIDSAKAILSDPKSDPDSRKAASAILAKHKVLDEKSKSQAQFRTMAAVAHNPKFAKKVGISQKVGKEFHKADKGVDYKSLPKEVDEAQWYPDREYIPKSPRKRKPQTGNRVMDISVGSPKIYYKGGKAVGEVGIDPEASPGNGSYYMKHYLSGKDMVGYDTPLEAAKELSHLVRQEVDEGVAEGLPGGFSNSDYMPGAVHKHNSKPVSSKKIYTDKKQWLRDVDEVNHSVYDDNSEYIGQTGRSTVTINGREWARWSDAQQKGYIDMGGMSEGVNDTVYPNAEVIKSKNGKPVGEIYQDGAGWGCLHYAADYGWDSIDSREDAIEALKELHQEYRQDRSLREGSVKLPSGDYQNTYTGVRSSKPPQKKKRGQKTGAEWDAIEKKKKEQGVAEEKQRLDPKCWKGYKKQGTKMKGDTRVNNCVPVSEAEVSEDKLAQDLYKDLQIFKKGADKDIGAKAKNKDISSKAQDKDIIAKEDWQKTNKSDKTDGMSPKAVKAYRRENPGSKLQTAVTKKPSELKAGSKDANRRKSFCARMSGNKGPMKDEHGKPTPKAKALRRWNC